MTRSQFVLGAALLCVSGTVAFMISFRHQEERLTGQMLTNAGHDSAPQLSLRSQRDAPLPLENRSRVLTDATHYEVSVSDTSLSEVGAKIERESKVRLQAMTDQLQLTPNQRRQIFPLLVQHHADFTEGLIVNGRSADTPLHDSFAAGAYPVLDLVQQETYQEFLLADNEFWGEIISQWREDLDGAFESGEVDLATSKPPATSDGSEIENHEAGLENFFGN